MISINVIGEKISGSYGNTPFSRTYEKDIYDQMVLLADQADQKQKAKAKEAKARLKLKGIIV